VGTSEWETESFRAFRAPVRPFLKWAGSKRSLLTELIASLETPIGQSRYFEPFLGSGSVFFSLQPSRAILSDINWPLIQTFKVVKNRVQALIDHLETLPRKPSHDHYYLARKRFNELVVEGSSLDFDGRIELAALMIWLNHTCFNGLYRVNSEGRFNVPIGFKVERHIFSSANLRAASLALKRARAELLSANYVEVLGDAKDGDVIYLDPPYEPVDDANSFTQYSAGGFSSEDQTRLAELATKLADRGCKVVISNSSAANIQGLYEGFDIRPILANRRIGSRSVDRGLVSELLISSRK
jgi:DNA adenine methylase